ESARNVDSRSRSGVADRRRALFAFWRRGNRSQLSCCLEERGMNIGVVGLGKLGMPIALTFAQRHTVFGYDVNQELYKLKVYPHRELGPLRKDDFQSYFQEANLRFCETVERLVRNSELIFVVVQTPHEPRFEGITPLPVERADFDYAYLKDAVGRVVQY